MARVLVADNCADTAETTAFLLRQWGHEVRVYRDGPSLLAAASLYRPDVVLTDVALRDLDGYEVARRLRQQAGPRRLRLVAITGYGRERDRRRAHEAGFDLHLVKPVDPEFLQEWLALSQCLTQQQA